jgi:hypothetical protein
MPNLLVLAQRDQSVHLLDPQQDFTFELDEEQVVSLTGSRRCQYC